MTEESSTRELVTVEHAISIYGSDDPTAITRRVVAIAQPLADFIKRQGMSTRIQGREYVLAEGWAFMGSMLGVFPVATLVRDLWEDDGGIQRRYGFEAHVELRTRDGSVVGGAVAECSRWEQNWRDRDDFALKSMAQTRATGKAYRMAFGFVMKAAGYEATPAEEMPSGDRQEVYGRGNGKWDEDVPGHDDERPRRGPYEARQRVEAQKDDPVGVESGQPRWYGPFIEALKANGIPGMGPVADYLASTVGPRASVQMAVEDWLEEHPELDVRDLAKAAAEHAKEAAGATSHP